MLCAFIVELFYHFPARFGTRPAFLALHAAFVESVETLRSCLELFAIFKALLRAYCCAINTGFYGGKDEHIRSQRKFKHFIIIYIKTIPIHY